MNTKKKSSIIPLAFISGAFCAGTFVTYIGTQVFAQDSGGNLPASSTPASSVEMRIDPAMPMPTGPMPQQWGPPMETAQPRMDGGWMKEGEKMPQQGGMYKSPMNPMGGQMGPGMKADDIQKMIDRLEKKKEKMQAKLEKKLATFDERFAKKLSRAEAKCAREEERIEKFLDDVTDEEKFAEIEEKVAEFQDQCAFMLEDMKDQAEEKKESIKEQFEDATYQIEDQIEELTWQLEDLQSEETE